MNRGTGEKAVVNLRQLRRFSYNPLSMRLNLKEPGLLVWTGCHDGSARQSFCNLKVNLG